MNSGQLASRMLGAGIAWVRGDEEASRDKLDEAISLASSGRKHFYAAVARRRLGQIVGGCRGDRLIEEAEGWMKRAGIKNCERMSTVAAPGFPSLMGDEVDDSE